MKIVANSNIFSIIPEVRFLKPYISGTRICVTDILHWIASGITYAEIIADYPILTEESIFVALAFSENRESRIEFDNCKY